MEPESKFRSDSVASEGHEDELTLAARAGMLLLEQNEELKEENDSLRMELEKLKAASVQEPQAPKAPKNLLQLVNEAAYGQTNVNSPRSESLEMNHIRRENDERRRLDEYRRESIKETNVLLENIAEQAEQLRAEQQKNQELNAMFKQTTTRMEELEEVVERMQQEKLEQEVERKRLTRQISAAKVETEIHEEFVHEYDEEGDGSFGGETDDEGSLSKKSSSASLKIRAIEEELLMQKELTDVVESEKLKLEDSIKLLLHEKHQMKKEVESQKSQVDGLKEQLHSLLEEQSEERTLIRNLRAMVQNYKNAAELTHTEVPRRNTSIGLELTKENSQLYLELSELRQKLQSLSSPGDVSVTDASNNNQEQPVDNRTIAVDEAALSVVERSPKKLVKLQTDYTALQHRCRNLEEKLLTTRQELHQTKKKWNETLIDNNQLQESIQRVERNMQIVNRELQEFRGSESGGDPMLSASRQSGEAQWKLETEAHPAPPGDLNSPLIQCLLDTWTRDKSKLMSLADWLHTAIRGTGNTKVIELSQLPSDVTAGFMQIFVPILQSHHGCEIEVYKRERQQVVTDIMLKTVTSCAEKNSKRDAELKKQKGGINNDHEASFLYG